MSNTRSKDVAVPEDQYSTSARKVLVLGTDGMNRVSESNPLPVNIAASVYSKFETGIVAPGESADGYDVKTVGEMFAIVTTSLRTVITNNDSSESIVVYLNTDGENPITISALSSFEIMNFAVSDIFIDTEAGHVGTVEIVMFGL